MIGAKELKVRVSEIMHEATDRRAGVADIGIVVAQALEECGDMSDLATAYAVIGVRHVTAECARQSKPSKKEQLHIPGLDAVPGFALIGDRVLQLRKIPSSELRARAAEKIRHGEGSVEAGRQLLQLADMLDAERCETLDDLLKKQGVNLDAVDPV